MLAAGGFRDYRFDVPADALLYGDNQLALRWTQLRSPSEIDPSSPDRRLLAAALTRVSIQELRSGNPAPAVPRIEAADGGVGADEARAFLMRIPQRARLSASIVRDAASAFGTSGVARVSIRCEGEAIERDLAMTTLSAFGRAPRSFAIDLAAFGGKIARLSLRVDGSPGFRARWSNVRLCAADPFRVDDALGCYQRRPATVARGDLSTARPNVIAYLMDALRARELGAYGQPEITSPFLDRLSREGALLEENVTQASNTPPAVKALLTGKYLPLGSVSQLPEDVRTIGQAFAGAGYRTAAFCNSPWPAYVDALRGISTAPSDVWYDEKGPKTFDAKLTDALSAWVGADATPFFAYLHSIHPHNPYTPVPPWGLMVPGDPGVSISGATEDLLEYQHARRKLSAAELADLERLYRLDLLGNDFEIARLSRRLGRAWAPAAFLLIADHGDEFGEHGGILHGYTSYDEMVRVPAILRAQGVPAGTLVSARTESVDLGPTLLDLANVPPLPDADGRTLRGLLSGSEQGRARVYTSASSAPGIYTVIEGDWKYVFAPRNGLEVGIGEGSARVRERFFLWNTAIDPLEKRNRVHDEPVLAAYFHHAIRCWLDRTLGSRPEGAAAPITPEMKTILKALGYLDEGPPGPARGGSASAAPQQVPEPER
ncbi:MAG: sulfatase-like hydrolase/transferase [Acidobacteriota bacterium]